MHSSLVPIPLQDTTVTQTFSVYRIHSVTRPNVSVGLLQGFSRKTRQELEAFTAESLGFYVDSFLMHCRGDERHTEQFMLQASASLEGPWEDIISVVPLPGDPDDMFDEDDDDRWGQCKRCENNLSENEAALSDTCASCRDIVHLEWQDNQDRLAERAAEARWIM